MGYATFSTSSMCSARRRIPMRCRRRKPRHTGGPSRRACAGFLESRHGSHPGICRRRHRIPMRCRQRKTRRTGGPSWRARATTCCSRRCVTRAGCCGWMSTSWRCVQTAISAMYCIEQCTEQDLKVPCAGRRGLDAVAGRRHSSGAPSLFEIEHLAWPYSSTTRAGYRVWISTLWQCGSES